jgi:hypothetical protein
MRICKKQFVARGFLIIAVSALLSMSFAISRHFVPQGLRRVITINHQIRRVLLRAERENLRNGVAIQKVPLMMNPPQELTELFRPFESGVTDYKISSLLQLLIEPKNLIRELSPVLNI